MALQLLSPSSNALFCIKYLGVNTGSISTRSKFSVEVLVLNSDCVEGACEQDFYGRSLDLAKRLAHSHVPG